MNTQTTTNYFLATFALLTVGTLTLCGAATDQNWPQWRGPMQNGVAPSANPPAKWSETENIKWKTKIPGDGTATPLIWEKKVFVQTAIATGKKGEAVPAAQTSSPRPERGGGPGVGPG